MLAAGENAFTAAHMQSCESKAAADAAMPTAGAVAGTSAATASTISEKKDAVAPRPESYLVIFNVAKRQNWGTLMRSACAFGVSEILVVGAKKLQLFGNQGTDGRLPQRNFESLPEAKSFLASRGARLCGIEIDDTAKPVHMQPFTGPTAFMLGNEGTGMTPQQRAACDLFVYIPQHSDATASLNVAVAGAIVLHHFAMWAGLPEQARVGEKYVVAPARSALDKYTDPTAFERAEIEQKRAARAAKRPRGVEDAADAAEEAVPDSGFEGDVEGLADDAIAGSPTALREQAPRLN